VAVPKFRPSALLEARERAGLTQLQLATLADRAFPRTPPRGSKLSPEDEAVRRIRTWDSRIRAWERGIDAPSAPYIPTLAQLLDLPPLSLFDIDPAAPTFTALRLAAGLTLQALADRTGLPYTSLHRMVRGVTQMPTGTAGRLAEALGVTRDELLASVARDR
jgi:transcriptional regulator with XRE-family HTH domain